jgi:hypothetical protein
MFLFPAWLCAGAVIPVPPGSDIQAAIDAATDGDTILAGQGEHVIDLPLSFKGKAITVQAEGDGTINLGDPIAIMRSLFCPAYSIPPPYPACGPDPTDDELGCEAHDPCQ